MVTVAQMKFILTLMALCSCVHAQTITQNTSGQTTFFAFGDSLIDPGNNNYLSGSLAKANYPFNGIDFSGGATGRFCNGRTVFDIICDFVGSPYPPPYMAPATIAGADILGGVNYASAASGVLDGTGANYVPERNCIFESTYRFEQTKSIVGCAHPGSCSLDVSSMSVIHQQIERISMNQQINNFANTVSQLQSQLGTAQAANMITSSICFVSMGSNDFLNNYLLSGSSTRFQYTPGGFNNLVLSSLDQQMTALYNFGLRKFVLSDVGPIGCIPDQLAMVATTTCIGSTNAQIQDFNVGLKSLLSQLTGRLPGSTFLYFNVFDTVNEFVANPSSYGFQVVNEACCGSGLYKGQLPCFPTATVCSNRDAYVFWDPFHPTEAANKVLANLLYSGGQDVAYPVNFQELIRQS